MATIKPSKFKIIQVYGGLKAAYFEAESVAASDTIDFSDHNVNGIHMVIIQEAASGDGVGYRYVGGSDIEIDAAFSGGNIRGIIYYRAY